MINWSQTSAVGAEQIVNDLVVFYSYLFRDVSVMKILMFSNPKCSASTMRLCRVKLNTRASFKSVEVLKLVEKNCHLLLRHLEWFEAADLIVKGMEAAIAKKTVTYDFERLMDGAKLLKCSEFGDAMIENM